MRTAMAHGMRFTVRPCGDPYNRRGYEVIEHTAHGRVFRGDLSPVQGKARTYYLLHKLYPGCKVRFRDW